MVLAELFYRISSENYENMTGFVLFCVKIGATVPLICFVYIILMICDIIFNSSGIIYVSNMQSYLLSLLAFLVIHYLSFSRVELIDLSKRMGRVERERSYRWYLWITVSSLSMLIVTSLIRASIK